MFVVAFIAFRTHIMNGSLADYKEQAVQTTQVNNNVPTEPNVPKVTEPQRGRIQGSVIDVENKDIVIGMLVTVD
jgi:hypothetical protein